MATNAVILNHHGLGDTVMLVPAIRRFKKLNPEKKVHLLSLARFEEKPSQLLSGLPYVEKHVPILPDAWNDFPSYDIGINAVIEVGQSYAEKLEDAEVYPLFCYPYSDISNFKANKLFRFAKDLRIEYAEFSDLKLELVAHDHFRDMARLLFRSYTKPSKIFHRLAGNPIKDLEYETSYHLFKEGTTFEFGDPSKMNQIVFNHILFGMPSMELVKAMVVEADEVFATDSVIMHIAFAFNKVTTAIFQKTPAVQAAPISEAIGNVNFGFSDQTLGVGLHEIIEDVRKYFESNNRNDRSSNITEMFKRPIPGLESNSAIA